MDFVKRAQMHKKEDCLYGYFILPNDVLTSFRPRQGMGKSCPEASSMPSFSFPCYPAYCCSDGTFTDI